MANKRTVDRKTEGELAVLEYESQISSLKVAVSELKSENKRLKEELLLYKNKDGLISSTLKRAESIAEKTEKDLYLKYSLEVERLRQFSKRWDLYFKTLQQQYPLYQVVKNACDIKKKLDELLKEKDNAVIIKTLETEMEKTGRTLNDKIFNPKEKIENYIAATEGNGFNLDEVLNPGELKLEDLCKELGLME